MEPLNGLRGAAAFCVAAYHAQAIFGRQIAPGGYLAVDLFFVLSGFVIAHAYEGRLGANLSPGQFFWLRLKRFYPLYALGLLISAAWMSVELAVRPPAILTAIELAAAFGFGLAYLPGPVATDMYPLNPPSWSLLFEIIVNAAYAFAVPLLTTRALAAVAGLSWAALVVALIASSAVDVSGGATFDTAHIGLLRAIFSFSVGVMLFRNRALLPRHRVHPAILIVVLAALLCISASDRLLLDMVAITLVFPAGIAAIATAPASRWDRLFAILGAVSFPLYAIHFPLFQIGLALKDEIGAPPFMLGTAFLAVAGLCAFAAHHWFDQPLQRRLRNGPSPKRRMPRERPPSEQVSGR